MRARKTSEQQRLEIAINHEVAARLRRAAARRDLSVRQYVLHAIEERMMTANTDPVLAALWNNRRDAAYDRL